MGVHRIGQHQHFGRAFMREEIVDALFLHQAIDEIQIGFAVLQAKIARLVSAAQLAFDMAPETVVSQNVMDDIGRGFGLKHPAFPAAGQEPDPGPHIGREVA